MVKSVQASISTAAYERLRSTLERERQSAEQLIEAAEESRADNPDVRSPASGGRGRVVDIVA